jgi:phosphoribosylaminoimidazolecarboxamide formyltransferase/IMP cyclohydrolase
MITHLFVGFELNLSKHLPYVAIAVKHGNACGVGLGKNRAEALKKMIEGDVKAIHGGSIFTNFKIDEDCAEILIHYKMKEDFRRLLDTITASDFTEGAIEILARKKGKCRIVKNSNLAHLSIDSLDKNERVRYIRGGFLTQPNYTFVPNIKEAAIEGDKNIIEQEKIITDLILAWAIGCTSNSNTITIVRNGKLLGNGVGQQDRVGAAKLAIQRADDASFALDEKDTKADLENAVAYSDSFFPFSDGPKVLIDRGIKTIFTTSGSVNDKDVIKSCTDEGATLIMFPDKVARGFAWH